MLRAPISIRSAMRVAIRGFLALAGLMVVAVACGCASSNPVVARVGADALSKAELDHWISVGVAVEGRSPGLRDRMLGFLISTEWLLGEARELGLTVSKQDARKQLEVLMFDQRTGAPRYGLHGLPRERDARRLLLSPKVKRPDRLLLMQLGLLAMGIDQKRLAQAEREISHGQIASFYRTKSQLFHVLAQREIEILGNYKQHAVKGAKREIEAGVRFLTVAHRVSMVPEAPDGLQHVIRGQEEPEFDKTIFAATPHVLLGPVKEGYYYIFEVLKATPGHRLPLARVQATIRRRLASRRASTKLLAAYEAKWAARTSCAPGYVVPRCRQFRTSAAG
jgi:foldase protein PrsA